MGTLKGLGVKAVLTICVLLAGSAAYADNDPPSRAARIDYISGEVSIQPGGVNDWVAASLNRPMTTADRIWTDKDSRAEVQVGGGVLRMDAETSVTLSNVGDNTVQVELDQGVLNLHVRNLYPGEIYEIDTPNTAFTVTKGGDYRFNVNSNNDVTLVTVWRGQGQATGDGPAVKIKGGEQGSFSGGRSLAHTVYPAPGPTGFDDWCSVRDKRQDSAVSARYVAPGVVGYEDLDSYGAWRTYPGYGPVWVPTVVTPGWAPYRYGHWVYVAPWGWSWVDDAPWGFAPFHYGRWAYVGGSWGWCPGPVYVRPVYAPALVAWVGGPNWGVSFGIGGGVGWFPLGYGEPYIPWYHTSRGYFQNVNVTNTRIVNITNVTNNYYNNNGNVNNIHYVNRGVTNAVTAVPQRAFVNSQSVARNAVPVSGENLRNASVVGGSPVAPNRASVLGVNANRPAAIPPQRAFARQPVRNMTPPAAPVSPLGNERNNNVANGNAANPGAAPSRFPQRNDANVGSGPQAAHNPQQNQNVAETTPNGRAVPRPPTSSSNGGNPPRMPNNNESARTPNTNANTSDNVVRSYPHPPATGERQPTGTSSPANNPQNQPARTYTPAPSQNQGGANRTYSAAPSQNQPEANRSYAPPANQNAPARTYSPPPQSQQPTRSYSPPAENHAPAPNASAPAAQPHTAPRPPANAKPEKEQHPNTSSVYGGSPSVAGNYSYPRPTLGAVRPAPAMNYSAGSSDSGRLSSAASQQRNYPTSSSATAQRSYSVSSQGSNGYSPSRTQSYSAPARSYSAPTQSYSAPAKSYSAPPARSYSSQVSSGRSYSAPSTHYSAPAPSRSGGSVARSSASHSGGGSTHGH